MYVVRFEFSVSTGTHNRVEACRFLVVQRRACAWPDTALLLGDALAVLIDLVVPGVPAFRQLYMACSLVSFIGFRLCPPFTWLYGNSIIFSDVPGHVLSADRKRKYS